MPSPRYIQAPETSNWIGETLKTAIEGAQRNMERDRESDALKQIYKQYQEDGQNLEKAYFDIQSNKNIGPTAKVNMSKQLTEFKKYNEEGQKALKAETEKRDKEAKEETAKKTQLRTIEKANNLEEGALEGFESNTSLAYNITKPKKAGESDADIEKTVELLDKAGATAEDIALYKAAPVGGKTEIVKNILEGTNRQKSPEGLVNKNIEDYDLGLTPKERVKRQDQRFTVQTPMVNKNNESLRSLKSEEDALNLISNLDASGKIAQGIQKLNINPLTGDLILPGAATPEEQLMVKTINDFTVKAKDSYGGRVTNFELDRFMQRLPTLANSAEGRKLIVEHMKIVNQAIQLEKQAIQEVFDTYGVRNIDYPEAERIAREKIAPQAEELRKKAEMIELRSQQLSEEKVEQKKLNVKEGYEALMTPEGKLMQFPKKNVENLLKSKPGYKRV